MGVLAKTVSVSTLAVGAVLLKIFGSPQMSITLERQSIEYDLREGSVYTEFLKDAQWEAYNEKPLEVDSIFDVPFGLDRPKKYRLSDEALAKVCPFTESNFTKGLEEGVKILRTTPKVAYTGANVGYNAVGCMNLSYISTDSVALDTLSDKMFLHFDGHAHKTFNPDDMKRMEANAVSNFFSNFSAPFFSAPLHATMVSSTVVMCAGVKSWFFFHPECCNDFGHHLYSGALLGKGFSPSTKVMVMQTRPGDVVTFGSFQHHMVITESGPTFMQTYRHLNRKIMIEGIKRFGWSYVKALYDGHMTNVKGGTANQAQEHPLRSRCNNDISEDAMNALQRRIYSMVGKN